MIDGLRPGYSAPTRKTLGEQHLDDVYKDNQQIMKDTISGKSGTLIQDGWSNVHNDPIVAASIQVEGKTFFLNSVDTGAMPKSAENCKTLCEDSIKIAKEEYGCTIKSIVTDNAANMSKMRQSLKENDPSLAVYGCSAPLLNLLGDDVTPQQVMKHVKDINKHFRNHHKPSVWLKEHKESVKPQLPGDTRWKSQLTALETFVTNRRFLLQICEDHENEMDTGISRKINDIQIYRSAKHLIEQLTPIANAIDTCQSDATSLADKTTT